MQARQGRDSSHHLPGAVSRRNVFPGYAKSAYPGLMFLHASGVASPEGCMECSPGWSVLCDTRGFEYTRKSHPGRGPGRGAGIIWDSSASRISHFSANALKKAASLAVFLNGGGSWRLPPHLDHDRTKSTADHERN